jgi:hypothetical protein
MDSLMKQAFKGLKSVTHITQPKRVAIMLSIRGSAAIKASLLAEKELN